MNNNAIPRPKKGDRLFRSDIDRWHNACLNFCPEKHHLYALGYKRAGDLLIEHVLDKYINHDTLVYPIGFLYRQYIELQLKELISKGSLLLDEPKQFPKTHNIDKLWAQCRKILEKIFPEDNPNIFNATEECIHQFSEKDPTSEAFRYPIDKKGKKLLPGLTHINLKNFSDIMSKLSNLLDAADMGISYELDIKWEIERGI